MNARPLPPGPVEKVKRAQPLRQELTLWEDPVYPQETVEGNPGSNGMENSGCLGRERRDRHDWVLRGGSMGE